MTAELTVADVASQWRLPAVLVVPVRLGAIAAAVANVALAEQKKVKLLGIVLNCTRPCPPCPNRALGSGLDDRVAHSGARLGDTALPQQTKDLEALAAAAAQLNLEQLMPKAFWA